MPRFAKAGSRFVNGGHRVADEKRYNEQGSEPVFF